MELHSTYICILYTITTALNQLTNYNKCAHDGCCHIWSLLLLLLLLLIFLWCCAACVKAAVVLSVCCEVRSCSGCYTVTLITWVWWSDQRETEAAESEVRGNRLQAHISPHTALLAQVADTLQSLGLVLDNLSNTAILKGLYFCWNYNKPFCSSGM